ncbi:MAG: hypothetical protein DVB22_002438, partial [Verrucomicrobia bacterium]
MKVVRGYAAFLQNAGLGWGRAQSVALGWYTVSRWDTRWMSGQGSLGGAGNGVHGRRTSEEWISGQGSWRGGVGSGGGGCHGGDDFCDDADAEGAGGGHEEWISGQASLGARGMSSGLLEVARKGGRVVGGQFDRLLGGGRRSGYVDRPLGG